MGSKVTLGEELLYPSKYLCAFDCDGKDLTLTITGIDKEELQMRNGGKKVKPVATFKEVAKGLVVNVTNANSIAQMYGTKAETWVGKQIAVYPTKVQFGREMVDAIRVREKIPEKPNDASPVLMEWNKWLETDPGLEEFNAKVPEVGKLTGNLKKVVWGVLKSYASPRWEFDKASKLFVPVTVPEVDEFGPSPEEGTS